MFKTRNTQPTLANQQPLDEIELISGQEMVELSGQELMNVVGGNNQDTDPKLVNANVAGQVLAVDYPPDGKLTIYNQPNSDGKVVTTEPA